MMSDPCVLLSALYTLLVLTPVLSVLLMGMLPVLAGSSADHLAIGNLPIAPPSLFLRKGAEALNVREKLSASGVFIADFDSGQMLYQIDGQGERPMASLTKLMTALLIVERHELSEWVKVPASISQLDGTTAYFAPGQEFTVGDLLSALLISSANDAAETLAVYHSGNERAFAEAMNARAKALGLTHTSFANSVGLDDADQWSTPQDIAVLSRFIMRYPFVADRLGRAGLKIASRKNEPVYLTHTHAFIHADTGVVAGKTGTTNGAGQCLMSVVQEGGRKYLVVLFNSLQRYDDMRLILDALRPSDVL